MSLQKSSAVKRWIREHFNHDRYHSGSSIMTVAQRVKFAEYQHFVKDKPLAYILKSQPFGELPQDLVIRSDVLIPRPETEQWSLVLRNIIQLDLKLYDKKSKLNVLDVCSGSGCISLHLANYIPQVHVKGVDVSRRAVQVANLNARKLCLDKRVRYCVQDIFTSKLDDISRKFDLIVCNPPYISDNDFNYSDVCDGGVQSSVKLWEDRRAITGNVSNQDGLSYYRRLLELMKQSGSESCSTRSLGQFTVSKAELDNPLNDIYIRQIPKLVLEIGGAHQTEQILDMFRHLFRTAQIWIDFGQKERAIAFY
ncbi:hypothetical protein MIR68_011540 [Amoeboaphelidium protococcarum]|nr:hypothetical protein MIR68_011540 [Amoeboaphelidium protococcarum]